MTAVRAAVRERWGEVTAFALLTAVGAAVAVSSFSYGITDDGGRVGPGFMPLVLGGLLFALGGIQLVARLRPAAGDPAGPARQPGDPVAESSAAVAGSAAEPAAAAGPAPDSATDPTGGDVDSMGRTQAFRIRQLWTVAAAIFVGILLVPYVGFLIAFGALVLFISVVVERRPWLGAVVITGIAVAVVYAVFGVFLNVPLPTGLIAL